ncbi:hypothetical protein K2Q00_01165 [Patescibacteria group bacterium]|nr:hypothetical protein [Patescibacteria group bacterium]
MQRQKMIGMFWCLATAFVYAAMLVGFTDINPSRINDTWLYGFFGIWVASTLIGLAGVWLTCPRNPADSRLRGLAMLAVFITGIYYTAVIGVSMSSWTPERLFFHAAVFGIVGALHLAFFKLRPRTAICATCSCQS